MSNSGKERAHKHKKIRPVTSWVGGGSPDHVCPELKERKHIRPGTRPGGSVTGVAEKLFMCQLQGRKRNLNPNFLVRISSGGVGVFHARGWGPKSSLRPSKPRETKLLAGYPGILAGISRVSPKSLRIKKLVFNFWSLVLKARKRWVLFSPLGP